MIGSATILDFKAPSEPRDSLHLQSIDFLRRFAELMAGGRNAANLLQAAEVIEVLASRGDDAAQQVREEAERSAAHRESCLAAQLAIEDLKSGSAALEQRLLDEQLHYQAERTDLADENQRLQIRAEQAEAELSRTSAELASLRDELAALGDSLLVVPAATMHMARKQFQSLATACEQGGDIVATAMCEIGSRLIERAIAGSAIESER